MHAEKVTDSFDSAESVQKNMKNMGPGEQGWKQNNVHST